MLGREVGKLPVNYHEEEDHMIQTSQNIGNFIQNGMC